MAGAIPETKAHPAAPMSQMRLKIVDMKVYPLRLMAPDTHGLRRLSEGDVTY
jgi:hypothetical protein